MNILARFVPVIRTFTPFVVGLGRMMYRVYLPFDILGGLVWVSFFIFDGYFFGNMPWVKSHFHVVILAVVSKSARLFPTIFL